MARVDSIDNTSPYSVFGAISKGIVGGGIIGYAAKTMLPLQESEKNKEYWASVAEIKNQSKKVKGIVIDEIRRMENKSPAQDVFLKVVDAQNEKPSMTRRFGDFIRGLFGKKPKAQEVVHAKTMRQIIRKAGLDMKDTKELQNIIAQVNEKAKISAKRYLRAYDAAYKSMRRPGIAYITVGAVAGFFGGLAYKILNMNSDN